MRRIAGLAALILISTLACSLVEKSPAPEIVQWTLYWKSDGRWKLIGNNSTNRTFRVEWVVLDFLDRDGFREGWDRRGNVTIPGSSKKTLQGMVPREQRLSSSFYPEKAHLEFPDGSRVEPRISRRFY